MLTGEAFIHSRSRHSPARGSRHVLSSFDSWYSRDDGTASEDQRPKFRRAIGNARTVARMITDWRTALVGIVLSAIGPGLHSLVLRGSGTASFNLLGSGYVGLGIPSRIESKT